MSDEQVNQVVARAVQQAFDAWAIEHPTLAGVIDQIRLADQVVQSLRQTPEYQQALAEFRASQSELALANQLLDLAGPILARLLGA